MDSCVNSTNATSSCNNTFGSFACVTTCLDGYELQSGGLSCLDQDECSSGTHGCGTYALCSNTVGSYGCSCPVGFVGDGLTDCADIDECLNGTHNCANITGGNSSGFQTCNNTIGSFTCECLGGYETMADFICQDDNECLDGTHNCAVDASCFNTFGSYSCRCADGFEGNGDVLCEDIDECANQTHTCVENADCNNTVGSFACACSPGYAGNGYLECLEVDECATSTHNCVDSENGTAFCNNTVGSFSCLCFRGFELQEGVTCEDVDECATGAHGCSNGTAVCVNTLGSHYCECVIGYSLLGDNVTCVDVDECATEVHSCLADSLCENNIGSYECPCNRGYEGDGFVACVDADECVNGTHNCVASPGGTAVCNNTVGSFFCECLLGFELQPDSISCVDIDECALEIDDCTENADCNNTLGSFACTCNTGYAGDGVQACENIDECALEVYGYSICDFNSYCLDNDGSFECICFPGWFGNGTVCDSLCDLGLHNCSSTLGLCKMTELGQTECVCKPGYVGDGVLCEDINECSGNNTCHPTLANCSNTFGSFECTCNAGYEGNGTSCVDADECLGENECAGGGSSLCVNREGSYECFCRVGFTGNGTYCSDNDECLLETDTCDPQSAVCNNTFGSFECICATGYNATGTACVDIDECTTDAHTCPANSSSCANTPGSFLCLCSLGYGNEGSDCVICPEDTYKDTLGNGTCTPCFDFSQAPQGSHSLSSCQCNAGYAPNGAFACTICPANTYKEGVGSGSCSPCPANASSFPGSVQEPDCKCAAGFAGITHVNCSVCPSGTYSDRGATNCTTCPPNSDSGPGGATVAACICNAGYTLDAGATRCAPCQEGSYKNFSGNEGCLPCPPGSSSPAGSAAIFNCTCFEGRTGAPGQACSLCGAGQYKEPDNTECQPCPNNTISQTGAESRFECTCVEGAFGANGFACALCLEGTFKSVIGSEDCQPCTANSTSRRGATAPSDCTCNAGFQGSGDTGCQDIDECVLGVHACQPLTGICTNTEGSFECACLPSYFGNGTTCIAGGLVVGITIGLDQERSSFTQNRSAFLDILGSLTGGEVYEYETELFPYNITRESIQPGCTNDTNSSLWAVAGWNVSICSNRTNRALLATEETILAVDIVMRLRLQTFVDVLQNLNEPAVDSALTSAGFPFVLVIVDAYLVSSCGNGWIEDLEQCDDENANDGDGCSSVCQVEQGWRCTISNVTNQSQTCPSAVESCRSSSICADVNECDVEPAPCHRLASCINLGGSFVCRCLPGYTGDGVSLCEDVPVDNSTRHRRAMYPPSYTQVLTDSSIDGFGLSLALHKDLLIVGSLGGLKASVFERSPDMAWLVDPIHLLHAPAGFDGTFGTSVAIYSNYPDPGFSHAVVGTNRQQVFVFEGQFGVLDRQPDLVLEHSDVFFGTVVATSSSDIVVGAYGSGFVHVYRQMNGRWPLEPSFSLSDGLPNSYFGHALTMTESQIVVAAPVVDRSYIFVQDGMGWPSSPSFTLSTETGKSIIETSLSMSDDYVFVGNSELQLVRVFSRDANGSWTQSPSARLSMNFGKFGACVANTQLFAVVGAFRANEAFIFRTSQNGSWVSTPSQQLMQGQNDSEAFGYRSLGYSCAISNHDVVLGSYKDSRVYIHSSTCDEGFYGSSIHYCAPCPPFSSSPLGSRRVSQCSCIPGYFEDADGACLECVHGNYCPGGGGSLPCGPDQTSRAGSSSVADCIENAFVLKTVRQSSRRQGAANNITIALAINVDLPLVDRWQVTVSGLTCGASACALCTNSTDVFSALPSSTPAFSWSYQPNGALVLTQQVDIVAFETYEFSICLRNPSSGQPSPAISVKASGVVFEEVPMDAAPSIHAPLVVSGIRVASISQSTAAQGVRNTVHVTFSTFDPLLPGTRLLLSGLLGADEVDGPIEIRDVSSAVMDPVGSWAQDGGVFEAVIVTETESMQVYDFEFYLRNGESGQASPSVTMSVQAGAGDLISASSMSTDSGPSAILFIASFTSAEISQSTPLPLEMNRISITFSTDIALSLGVVVTIAGLVETTTPSTNSLRIRDVPGGNATDYLGSLAAWSQPTGEATLAVTQAIPAGLALSFSFDLTNPAAAQPAATVLIATGGFTLAPYPMTTAALGSPPLLIGGLLSTRIAQTSSCPGADNVLSISLRTATRIPYAASRPNASTSLVVRGLSGSTPRAGANSSYSATLLRANATNGSMFWEETPAPFRSTSFDPELGTLVLDLQPGFSIDAGVEHQVRLPVINPQEGRDAARSSMEGTGGGRIPETALENAEGDAAPLRISGFASKHISQATTVPGINNTFAVVLSFFTTVPNGTTVTITGLVGSTTPNTTLAVDQDPPGAFASEAEWTRPDGKLILTVAENPLESVFMAGAEYRVSFDLQNPSSGQYAPQDIRVSARHPTQCSGNRSEGVIMSEVHMDRGDGNSAPLGVAGFDNLVITQSNASQSAENVIAMRFLSFTILPRMSVISVKGIECNRGDCEQCCTLQLFRIERDGNITFEESARTVGPSAVFLRTGTVNSGFPINDLNLLITQDWNPGEEVVLYFRQKNNDFGQPATPLGSILVSAFSDPTEIGVRRVTLPPVPMTPGDGLAAPILINYVIFSSIAQSTTAAGALNTLQLKLSTLAGLSGGTKVVVSGLVGSPTPSGLLALGGPDAASFATAEWDANDASLELRWNVNGSEATREYLVTFQLQNPHQPQEPPRVSIRVLDEKASTVFQEVDNGLGFTGPLHVVAFTRGSIQQSTAFPGAMNTLTVTLKTTDCIAQASAPLITISGLVRTASVDTEELEVTVSEFKGPHLQWSIVEMGSWNQELGVLTFSISKNVDSDARYVVSFDLQNGLKGSLPASPMASASGAVDIASTPLSHPDDFRAPLFVTARLDEADVGQSTPSAATPNTITVSLSTQFGLWLDPGLDLTIAGLTGSATPSGMLPVSVSIVPPMNETLTESGNATGGTNETNSTSWSTTLFANMSAREVSADNVSNASTWDAPWPQMAAWTQGDGAFTLTSLETVCLEADQSLIISIELTNPSQPQFSPSVSVQVPQVNISWTTMRNAEGIFAPLLTAGLITSFASQSTVSQAADNTISILFTIQTSLLPGTTIDISGLTGTQTPSGVLNFTTSSAPTVDLNTSDALEAFEQAASLDASVFGPAQWDRDSGRLVFAVLNQTTALRTYGVSVVVRNPPRGQPAAASVLMESLGTIRMAPVAASLAPGNAAPMLVAGFRTKTIRQSTASMLAPNTISMRIECYASLSVSDTIVIAGLQGPAPPASRVAIEDASGVFDSIAVWVPVVNALIIPVVAAVQADLVYEVSFVVQNPDVLQESPSISIESTGTVALQVPMDKGPGNFAPLLVAGFLTSEIAQSSTSQGAENMLSVTLQSNALLWGDGSQTVRFAGLSGAQPLGTVVAIDAHAPYLSPTAVWDSATESVTVTVVAPVPPGQALRFGFAVRNPMYGQPSPNVTVELASNITTVPAVMEKGALDAAPLLILDFLLKRISQSTPSASAMNTISVTLQPTATIATGSRCTISGLFDTATPSGHINISQKSNTSFFESTASWNATDGTLGLTVQRDLGRDDVHEFNFTIQNVPYGQDPQPILIESVGSRIFPIAMDTALGNHQPILVADWLQKFISQSNPSAFENNTISVTLKSRAFLPMGTRVIISGLLGTRTEDSRHLPIGGHGPFASTASWTRHNGSLVMVASQSSILENTTYFVNFTLINRDGQQPSPSISIEAVGPVRISRAPMDKDVGNNAPLLVAGFSNLLISQSTSSQGAVNTITVSLTIDVVLPVSTGSALVIRGLFGSVTNSTDRMPIFVTVERPTSVVPKIEKLDFGTEAIWNAGEGSLTLTVGRDTLPGAIYVIQFDLVNPKYGNDAANATIAGRGVRIAEIDIPNANFSETPLLVADFLVRDVGQSSPSAGAMNEISVTIAMRAPLLPGTNVTITGLTGSVTESTDLLSIDEETASFGSSAQWNRDNGTLVIVVHQETEAHRAYVVNFFLENPPEGQDSPQVTIATGGTVRIFPVMMTPGPGNYAPLLVAGFVSSMAFNAIRQSTPSALAANNITIEVGAQAQVEPGGVITVSGLRGSLTPTGPLQVSGELAPLLNSSMWFQDGRATFTLRRPMEANQSYSATFALQNPALGQASPEVSIEISGFVVVTRIPMSRAPGNAAPLLVAGFSSGNISQSTPSAGAINTITVVFSVNVDIVRMHRVLISGLSGPTFGSRSLRASLSDSSLARHDSVDASWNNSSDTVTVQVSNLRPGVEYALRFNLTNPAAQQSSPSTTIAVMGLIHLVETSLLSDEGNQAPLLVAGFVNLSAGQSTTSQDTLNQISVTMVFNADLLASLNCRVLIRGLNGTATNSTESLGISTVTQEGTMGIAGSSASDVFGSTAEAWVRETGELRLRVHSDAHAGVRYVVRFELLNPSIGRGPANVTMSATGIVMSEQSVANAPLDAAPLFVTDFVLKAIAQSTPSASASNTLAVTFSTTATMLTGTSISVFGLVGSTTNSSEMLPVVGHGGIVSDFARWEESGHLEVVTVQDLEANTASTFSFVLENQASGQDSPLIEILTTGSTKILRRSMDSEVGNMAPMLVADFLLATIHQSSATAAASNTIRVSLITRAGLEPGTKISLSGLVNTAEPSGILPIYGNFSTILACANASNQTIAPVTARASGHGEVTNIPALLSVDGGTGVLESIAAASPVGWGAERKLHAFGNDGMWRRLLQVTSTESALSDACGQWDMHSGSLVLSVASLSSADTLYEFSFQVTNAAEMQESPSVTIAATDSVEISPVLMSKAEGNAAPLLIAGFYVARMGQSNYSALAENTLTLTLVCNADLAVNSSVILRGLAGVTPILNSSDILVDHISSAAGTSFPDIAAWDDQDATIRFRLVGVLKRNETNIVSIHIRNPSAEQQAPSLTIDVVGEPAISQNISGDSGLKAPLLIVGEITTAELSQNTTAAGRVNALRLRLSFRDDVRSGAGARVTLTGLMGSTTADTANLRVWSRDCDEAYGDFAEWEQQNGTLILTVIRSIPAGEECTVDFHLQNPLEGQESPPVRIAASGVTVLSTPVVPGEGPAAPLLVGDFLSASMSQDNPFIGGENTVNVTAVTRIDLPSSHRPRISLTGLHNVFDENLSTVAICVHEYECLVASSGAGGCCDLSPLNETINCSAPVLGGDGCFNATVAGSLAVPLIDPVAEYSASLGTLVVAVTADWRGRVPHSFSFSFRNPMQSRPPVDLVHIESSGVFLPAFNVTLGIANRAPFLAAGWQTKGISQSSTVAGALNTISISLACQATLHSGAAVTVHGLLGGVTPAGSVPVLNAPEFGTSALWEAATGTLTFTLAHDVVAYTNYVVQIQLLNPDFGRDGSSRINITASSADMLLIASEPMSVGQGNLMPFLIGDFVIKSIGQAWPTPSAENTITVTLAARIALTGNFVTKVTLVGLAGSGTPGRSDLMDLQPADTPFGPTARWTQGSGTIVLTMMDRDTVGREEIVVSFVLTNGDVLQQSQMITVSASQIVDLMQGPMELIRPSIMKNAPELEAPLLIAGFPSKYASQSNASTSALNMIALSFSVNLNLSWWRAPVLTISGLYGASTPSGTVQVDVDFGVLKDFCIRNETGDTTTTTTTAPPTTTSSSTTPQATTSSSTTTSMPPTTSSSTTTSMPPTTSSSTTPAPTSTSTAEITTSSSSSSSAPPTTSSTVLSASTVVTNTTFVETSAASPFTTSTRRLLQAEELEPPLPYCPFRSFNASWDQEAGVLVARVGFALEAFAEHTLSFALQNGNRSQPSPEVRVSLSATGAQIPPRLVDKEEGNGAVLLIAGWEALVLTQSTADAGSSNLVRLNLSTTGTLAAGTVLAITGISGPVDAAGAIPLEESSSLDVFGANAQWSASTGRVLLTVIQDTVPSHVYHADWYFTNPEDGQLAVTVSAHASGPLTIPPTVVSTAGDGSDLFGVAGFVFSEVEQSTASSGHPNVISVRFSTFVPLTVAADSSIVVDGLTGSTTPAGNLSLSGIETPNFGASFAGMGAWDPASGSLRVRVVRDTMASATYAFSFQLNNPVDGQASPSVSIQSEGVVSRKHAMTPGAGNAAPLLVADLGVSSIGQDTPSQLALNTITATLSTRASLLRGSRVTLSGLQGSSTSTSTLSVSTLNAPTAAALDHFSTTAEWQQGMGTLVLSVSPTMATIAQGTYVLTFQLRNPGAGRPPRTISISSEDPFIPPTAMDAPTGSNNEAMLVAEFTALRLVQEQSAAVAQVDDAGVYTPANISLSLTFATSARLLAGSRVVVENLTLSSTPSVAELPVRCSGSHLSPTANWSQQEGTLAIGVSGDTIAEREYQCNFTLLGPATGQEAPAVSVRTEGVVITASAPAHAGPGTLPLGVTVRCNPFTAPANGVVIAQDAREEAVVVCNKGFQLLGLRSAFVRATCGRDGQWGAAPACVEVRGSLRGWGGNLFGALGGSAQLGDAVSSPVVVHGLDGVAMAAGSEKGSYALLANGSVAAWGDNADGQAGVGTTSEGAVEAPLLVALGSHRAVSVAAGSRHGVALLADGTVRCWGVGGSGQLGHGVFSDSASPVQAVLPQGKLAAAVAAGDQHTVAVSADRRQVFAWGLNANGQAGTGAAAAYSAPQVVAGVGSGAESVVAVAAGRAHSLALLSSGEIQAWGDNSEGQLGDGALSMRSAPVRVQGLAGKAVVIACTTGGGQDHSVAMLDDGSVMAWGGNSKGQLGRGDRTSSALPVAVSGLGSSVLSLSAGKAHTLVALAEGGVAVWGWDQFAQLGDGESPNAANDALTAQRVSSINAAVCSVGAGWYHSLAIVCE